MIGESLAIVLIIVVLAFMYRRAGKKPLALLALPLLCVPAAKLVDAALFGLPVAGQPGINHMHIAVLAGLVLTAALCLFLARGIVNRKARWVYILSSLVFSCALTAVYLV